MPDDLAVELHSTSDAQVWAKRFMEVFSDKEITEGDMIAWFANAIERGNIANNNLQLEKLAACRVFLIQAMIRLHNYTIQVNENFERQCLEFLGFEVHPNQNYQQQWLEVASCEGVSTS